LFYDIRHCFTTDDKRHGLYSAVQRLTLLRQALKELVDCEAMETCTLALVRDVKARWKEEELKLGALKEECEVRDMWIVG
jgi:hypothetical protein